MTKNYDSKEYCQYQLGLLTKSYDKDIVTITVAYIINWI